MNNSIYPGETFQVHKCKGGWMYCNGNCDTCTLQWINATASTQENKNENS